MFIQDSQNSMNIYQYKIHFFHFVKKRISNVTITRTTLFRLHHHQSLCQG
jgi:hypothetical protein